jgi:hypothetical protein
MMMLTMARTIGEGGGSRIHTIHKCTPLERLAFAQANVLLVDVQHALGEEELLLGRDDENLLQDMGPHSLRCLIQQPPRRLEASAGEASKWALRQDHHTTPNPNDMHSLAYGKRQMAH